MAKSPEQKGKMREDLKKKVNPRKLVETVVNASPEEEPDNEPSKAPEDSAFKAVETAADQGDPVVSSSGEFVAKPTMISKPEVDLLARKFKDKKKEDELPLEDSVKEVKDRNAELQKMKATRAQACARLIKQLRVLDPKGIKTCGRCATRVPIEEMDSNKELCEVCAS
jgi:hypothetical protein